MRLVITQNITLDGVVEAVSDWFSPAGDERDRSDIRAELRSMMEREDAVLLGRITFEEFRGYWPRQAHDTTGITDQLNRVHKYVVSGTLRDPAWENTMVLSGAPLDEVRALTAQPGADLGVTGSIMLCRALIGAGLVDEYRLFVYPVELGRGRRLFADGLGVGDLEFVGATPFRSGVVLLTYTRH
jgi:dihydrofolate reductase